MSGKLDKYPKAYSRLILGLDPGGEPFHLPMASREAAEDLRMKLYNFLKFCRRNPHEVAHFGNRQNLISIHRQDNVLIVFLQVKKQNVESALDQALENAAKVQGIPLPEVTAPELGELTPPIIGDILQGEEQSNPLEVLKKHLEK